MTLDFDLYRQKLLERRAQLEQEEKGTEAERSPVALDQTSVGRLSRMDALQIQAMALAQQRRREAEEAAIDAALRRLDEGDYGICLKCGGDIAEARLAHAPAVTLCIDCARG